MLFHVVAMAMRSHDHAKRSIATQKVIFDNHAEKL